MTHTQNEKDTFCRVFGVPEMVAHRLHTFFEPEEISLILDLVDHKQKKQDPSFLARAFRRGVIRFNQHHEPIPADFHTRYEFWSLFEGPKDIPASVIKDLNRWELSAYLSAVKPVIENYRSGFVRDRSVNWPEYVRLNEALAVIEKAPHIFLWPCNCRSMIRGCGKPVVTCLRFDNAHDIGWEISKQKAGEIISEANRKGLMQSAELSIHEDGSLGGAICNCCSDCCFPVQAGNALKAEKLWPLSRYQAVVDKDQCSRCGLCVRRCPFDAFTLIKTETDAGRKPVKRLEFVPDLCRGCGLCAGTCPEKAIEMIALPVSPLSIVDTLL